MSSTITPEPVSPSRDDMTATLVMELRAGKARAGELLDTLYRGLLYRFCWGYLRHATETEDAVQDICYKVLSAREVPEAFRPWIYRVARNHCLNLIRGRKRRKDGDVLPDESVLGAALTGQLTRLARKEANEELVAMVSTLPEAYQEVLRLRYVEELPRSEIATILELSESVVKSRLFEGLKKLRAGHGNAS
ncbi:MAG: RNA polymerase sigma factor [Phycisphaerae bacterium]